MIKQNVEPELKRAMQGRLQFLLCPFTKIRMTRTIR